MEVHALRMDVHADVYMDTQGLCMDHSRTSKNNGWEGGGGGRRAQASRGPLLAVSHELCITNHS